MNDKLKAVLIGGVGVGIASGLPYIEKVNNACCALYIGAGILTVYLLMKDQPATQKAPYGKGSVAGLQAGAIAGAVSVVAMLITGVLAENAQQALVALQAQGAAVPEILELLDTSDGVSDGLFVISLVAGTIAGLVAGCIGGIVGVAIFHKKQAPGDT